MLQGSNLFVCALSSTLKAITQARISCIVPARWYIDAIRKMMIQGLPLASVAGDLAILSGMASFIMLVALKKFNDRLD